MAALNNKTRSMSRASDERTQSGQPSAQRRADHADEAKHLFGLAVRVAMSLLVGVVVMGIFGPAAERNVPGTIDVVTGLLTVGAVIVVVAMAWSMYYAFKSQA